MTQDRFARAPGPPLYAPTEILGSRGSMMNKAIPWNINGVGFDAREAAREAARRQGKSLGEWLHGVIADHASEIGVEEREIVGQDRIEAVTSRLERMSARATPFERRPTDQRSKERPHSRQESTREDAGNFEDMGTHRNAPPRGRGFESNRSKQSSAPIEDTEFLLEEAIDAMERRALRSERRTDEALESFGQMLERNEEKRDRERQSVMALTQKLSDIEGRLGDRDQNPIKGALARLEARLDLIGRRGTIEANLGANLVSEQPAEIRPAEGAESFKRLEDKLNAVLDAVKPKSESQASPVAIAASRAAIAPRGRRLGDAIAEISDRQRTLEDRNALGITMRRYDRRQDAARLQAEDTPPVFTAVKNDIAALGSKIDDIQRAIGSIGRKADIQPAMDLETLHLQIAAMTRTLGDFTRRNAETIRSGEEPRWNELPAFGEIKTEMQEIRDLISSARPVDLEPIESRLADLTQVLSQRTHEAGQERGSEVAAIRALEAHLRSVKPHTIDIVSLETIVRDLGAKIDAVQAPGAGANAIDALQRQMSALSKRFERSETGLASLSALERSMQDLFTHLEQTRVNMETAAANAARQAVQTAMGEKSGIAPPAETMRIDALKAMQIEADQRTHSTLEAVHETLEKVVDRLSVMEGDIADVRARPVSQPAPQIRAPIAAMADKPTAPSMQRPVVKSIPLEAKDPLGDPLFGRPPAKSDKPNTEPVRIRSTDLDEEAGRADFIAAARRAAQAAQTEPSVIAMRHPEPEDDTRADLIAKSQDYIATHKRPVLLSLAAVFLVIGTMAIVQQFDFGGNASQVADYAAPAKIVRSANVPSRSVMAASNSDLTPSALPPSAPAMSNPIPGSDPIQTGSIPSLPAFAARPTINVARQPVSILGLTTLAESGNGAAAFELGARYADGKVVPRDYKLAAKWYGKAADLGVAPGEYRLGSLYEKGLGVPQDKMRAKSLYLQAAEAGNPRAMHNLAVLLADGNGKPDFEGAATWFRKAAQYGVHDSQYNLAILLARGLGVQQSFVQSYQWFTIAAAQNDADATAKRDEIANKLGASDLAVAKALAASFRPRTPDLAAVEVAPLPGGRDGASDASPVNSARPKISSL